MTTGRQTNRRGVFRSRLVAAALAAALAVPGLASEGLPSGSGAKHGFSAERLARIGAAVDRELSTHRVAGAVTLVARDGRVVYFGASGWRNAFAAPPEKSSAPWYCRNELSELLS